MIPRPSSNPPSQAEPLRLPASAHLAYPLSPELRLDARGAVWFEKEETLAVADLHLGYAWAQRASGLLFPVETVDRTLDRLFALQEAYAPKQLVLLGDIVHRAVELPAILRELERLVQRLQSRTALRFVAGNHDRQLESIFRKLRWPFSLETSIQIGSHLLLHGDASSAPEMPRIQGRGGRTFIGHEHPVLRLGDGVATAMKCPCFVVGPHLVILPAFSEWAAGVCLGSYPFMSPLAQAERFTEAIAVFGDRLLRVPLT